MRASLLLLAMLPLNAAACEWDYDTLKQERSRFPGTLELITGKFLRHSREFYEWRIRDRIEKLKTHPSNLDYLDDLAVAYRKVGDHAKAVETILLKEKIKPGLYTTYSNLGTFYILNGEMEKGLPYIDKALAIDPDAHFGREKYQKWLVEYAISRKKDGKVKFPLHLLTDAEDKGAAVNFAEFLAQRLGKVNAFDLSLAETQHAVKGVLGMMRFANHANPLLLEALGDLLRSPRYGPDAKRLAARAYLKASYEVEEEEAKEAYRMLAAQALRMQTRHPFTQGELGLSDLEADFKSQLADAETWYAALKAKEIGWVRDGKDVEGEFDRLYQQEPAAIGDPATLADYALFLVSLLGVVIVVALLAGGFVCWRYFRRKRPQPV